MGLIPQSTIDDVLARTDIIQIVQQYVSLKKAGSHHKGLCPFHSEKTPSFNVSAQKGFYKCFGCGAGGNVIGFLMAIEGWNFPEAVRQLAERAGIEIPEETEEEQADARKRRDARKAYLHLMQEARDYYEAQLWGNAGRAARHYLQERGIDEQTARVFGLGFAPDGWSNLLDHLRRRDIPPTWVEHAGLALTRSRGDGHYDRFRHRIMFPVIDIWGSTLAFGGRVLAANDDSPKYVNSSETKFYVKGKQLYGLHAAKQAIQQREFAVLVEGNFDVIALYAMGVRNAVAPMGTAFTDDQASLLARYTRKLAVAFDGDSAGQSATLRCLPAFERAAIEARVVPLQAGEDPDSFIRSQGAEAFERLLDDADDLVLWAFDHTLPPAENGNIRQNVEAAEAAAEILGHVQNDAVRKRYVQELSRRLAIEPRVLNEYIRRPRERGEAIRQAVVAANKPVQLLPSEVGILTVLLDHTEWLPEFLAAEYDRLLNSEELFQFLHQAAAHIAERGQVDPVRLREEIEQPNFRETFDRTVLSEERGYTEERARQFYEDCVRTLKREWADRTLKRIFRDLEATSFENQRDQYEVLIEQQKQVIAFKQEL